MTVYLNNCRNRQHKELFDLSGGCDAFFDLDVTGKQGEMAHGLVPGDECVVASYGDDGKVVFDWYEFSHEDRLRNPDAPRTRVRVLFGKLFKSERLPKSKAARTEPYKVFFNRLGHFKRPSEVKPKPARRT